MAAIFKVLRILCRDASSSCMHGAVTMLRSSESSWRVPGFKRITSPARGQIDPSLRVIAAENAG